MTFALALPSAAVAGMDSGATVSKASPSRIIDRTLLCETALRAGVRKLDVQIYEAVREGRYDHCAAIELFSPWSPDAYMGGITEGSLTLNHQRRKPVRTRVRLHGRGLDGGPPGPFGERYDCTPPRYVLLRLRARFRTEVSLRVTVWDDQAPFRVMRARGRVREGYIAMQTRARKPLLFGSVSDTGKAKVLTAPICVPE